MKLYWKLYVQKTFDSEGGSRFLFCRGLARDFALPPSYLRSARTQATLVAQRCDCDRSLFRVILHLFCIHCVLIRETFLSRGRSDPNLVLRFMIGWPSTCRTISQPVTHIRSSLFCFLELLLVPLATPLQACQACQGTQVYIRKGIQTSVWYLRLVLAPQSEHN
jgi:hypothetical protein